ncbi:MAG: hypothetical protein CL484_01965 [Acidobacteria bacterium]|nr:hypothetical protein [Acidobacteriota bacterium]
MFRRHPLPTTLTTKARTTRAVDQPNSSLEHTHNQSNPSQEQTRIDLLAVLIEVESKPQNAVVGTLGYCGDPPWVVPNSQATVRNL